jgi:multidrug transporter EmrE-like cation transporter
MQSKAMPFVFIGLSILFTVVGQIAVKWGMMSVSGQSLDGNFVQLVLRILLNPGFMVGIGCAGAAAVSWALLLSLTKTPLSFAYPFMALPIVLVLALAGVLFGEVVPLNRWIGVIIVAIGIFVASRA